MAATFAATTTSSSAPCACRTQVHRQQLPRPCVLAPPPAVRAAVAIAVRAGKSAAGGGFAPKKAGGGFGSTKPSTNTSITKTTSATGKLPEPSSPCPCGSGQTYDNCCRPAHTAKTPAATPEALLRSRFAAYRLGLIDYLCATTHPSAPERRSAALGLAGTSNGGESSAAAAAEAYKASIARTSRSTDFVALAVDKAGADVRTRTTSGGSGSGASEGDEQEAFLSFRVWYRSKGGRGGAGKGVGGESVVRETSHFVKGGDTGGKWLYLGEAEETGGEDGKRVAAAAEAEGAAS
jgi:uncharacterized protein YchJ